MEWSDEPQRTVVQQLSTALGGNGTSPKVPGKKFSRKKATDDLIIQQRREDDFLKVKMCVDLLFDLFKIFGFRDTTIKNLGSKTKYLETLAYSKEETTRMYMEYVTFAGFGSWKDLFKYKFCTYYNYIWKQEHVPMPEGLINYPRLCNPAKLACGIANRWLRLIRVSPLINSFALSILMAKKGAPPVHEEFVKKAELSTFVQLTTLPKQKPDFEICENGFHHIIDRPRIEYELKRTVREVFKGVSLSKRDLYEPFFPSTNSNYNHSRSDGGAVSEVLTYVIEPLVTEGILQKEDLITFDYRMLDCEQQFSESYGDRREVEDQVLEELQRNEPYRKEFLGVDYDPEKLYINWAKVYDRMWQMAVKEAPNAIPIGLPEPFKVRVITAGPALKQTVLKPIQKLLWRTLFRKDVFRLIGEPVNAEIVTSALGTGALGEVFVSGDYKASTDNLHSWVSELLLDEVIACLVINDQDFNPEFYLELKTMMKQMLTGHMILHPDMKTSFLKARANGKDCLEFLDGCLAEQKEGQLMGSVISFPFLCLANAAICRLAMEISESKTLNLHGKYNRARLLINGDDCVFPGVQPSEKHPGIFSIWKEISEFIGLTSSVGKTYVHRDFFTINSIQFNVFNTWEENYIKQVPYVNMGLIYGQSKSGQREKFARTLGTLHNDLLRTCPEEVWTAAHKMFLKKHKDELSKYKVPWYVPEWLGGFGLNPKDQKVNKFDLLSCAVIRSKMDDLAYRPIKSSQEAKWQMHKFVLGSNKDHIDWLGKCNFRKANVNNFQYDLKEEYDKFYSLNVVSTLFRYGINYVAPEKSLLIETKEEKERMIAKMARLNYTIPPDRAFKHNERIWNRVHVELLDSAKYSYYHHNLSVKDIHDFDYEKNFCNFPLINSRRGSMPLHGMMGRN